MRKLLASLAITMGAVGAAHAQTDYQADADASAGQEMSQVCAACHGQQGISPSGAFPNLAGQQMSYLAKQIMDIRDGDRVVPQMAKTLNYWRAAKKFTVLAIWLRVSPPVQPVTRRPG